jgi:hypothetical protein
MEESDKQLIESTQKKVLFKTLYYKIIDVLKKYCDLREDYYKLVALWIIGTYFHDSFPTYPYLYFNAMRGSGKSRIMQLISKISKNGKVLINMSEAVLFRTAQGRTLLIDEFEGVGSKDKAALRELLNAAYKKGNCVERAKKVKKNDKEEWDIESYNVYCPIAMANIWGMDNVLADRCITLILEKSARKNITRMIEDFDSDPDIIELCELFKEFSVGSVVYDAKNNVYLQWNIHIFNQHHHTLPTLLTLPPQHTLPTLKLCLEKVDTRYSGMFKKISDTTLDGRYLELFFPLFLLANECNILDEIIVISENIVREKKEEDITENRDVALIVMLSQMDEHENFVSLRSISEKFNEEEDTDKEHRISPEWIGRAFKRLNLILEKRRLGKGIEVKINFKKVKEKVIMFKVPVILQADKEEIKEEEVKDENN